MAPNQNPDFPWLPSMEGASGRKKANSKKPSAGIFVCVLCIAVCISILLTYSLTFSAVKGMYAEGLKQKQEQINHLESVLGNFEEKSAFEKLNFLASLLEVSSYYADSFNEQEMLDAVLKAYVNATGDAYAEYYTVEEYSAILQDNIGSNVGIGVNIVQNAVTVEGIAYSVFQIVSIFQNSPAANSGLRVGDCIYAMREGEKLLTIADLGGYTAALSAFRGEVGSQMSVAVFRKEGTVYQSKEFSLIRNTYTSESVSYTLAEQDTRIGIVRISEFDLTTPRQFKNAVKALQSQGATRFVFDVRNNPGGDLQSIKAVLSYLLENGDLILSEVDRKGKVVGSYYAEPTRFTGNYESCSVSAEEVGMYGNLDMVVLCNENTASAAEVFTASLRDHKNVPIVGTTTFGKGIMQVTFDLSTMSYGKYQGYLKTTIYAYVTECGVTYHEIGISPSPNCEVELSDEAKAYNLYLLPQALDNQLQTAIAQLDSN